MRRIVFAGLLTLGAGQAVAGEIFVSFTTSRAFTFEGITGLEMEVDDQGEYMGASGSVILARDSNLPVTGTCYFTTSGGVFCNLRSDQMSLNVSLEASLSGTIEARSNTGLTIDSASISLTDIYRTAL